MAKWFASLRAILSLLFTLQPAKPFAASQGKVEALMRRNNMRYPVSLLASNIGPLDKEIPPTIIGRGSKIRAEKFSSMNSIIVEGELDVLYLECGHQAAIHVTSTGRLTGKVSGGVLVTVDGKLEGSVECYELVVGPRGVVTGDVICKDVIIRPGGAIGGQLSCENMKSERDIFHETKHSLQEVIYPSSSRNPPPRDSLVAALKAMSDRQTGFESTLTYVNTDEYGNPLIGGATDEQVLSLRKNREEIFATRNFLDKAMTRKRELPEWVNENPNELDQKHAFNEVIFPKTNSPSNKLGRRGGRNEVASPVSHIQNSRPSLSRTGPESVSSSTPKESDLPDNLHKHVENLKRKQKETKSNDDYSTLPDFLR